jgi:predicted membrane protein
VRLAWRDRVQLANSVLFCVVGAVLVARYFLEPTPLMALVLGVVFLAFGLYRLALARREMQKRVGGND